MSEPRSQVLYRMFSADRVLLYVGITTNVEDRLADHRGAKSWWSQVATIELQHFPTRVEVERAEVAAIRGEGPKFNVRNGTCPPSTVKTPGWGKPVMKHRNFRIEDAVWEVAQLVAELRGERFSEVLRNLVREYVEKHRNLLDEDAA